MAILLKGAPVVQALNKKMERQVVKLAEQGVIPTLAILRVGERQDDLAYERGAVKRCESVGVAVKKVILPHDVPADEFYQTLEALNMDEGVHGILMFRPLPEQIDNEKARQMLRPSKDVDGCTDGSLSGVFTNSQIGFAPCTAQAALEILDYYGVLLEGKKVAVLGRSLVVGRPVSMMLLHKNATVAIAHSKSIDVPETTKNADIVIVGIGRMESIGQEYFAKGQIVIDVGIGWNEKKEKLCGDVMFDEVNPIVSAITPVPGGVGAVTTAVLVSHVVEAACKKL
ncbi:bifunctional 5,10-methylenetetrahydrofolate dehydrogenase/5,10-methenyltetrahydrofolate cyclohydrolase [Eubacterium oxidoreducens]|uniref:Bifunctional protein FolD n=1 Tax=Eubacterium oxidoreducens TaxID=1732 RepID=A0A1G6B5F0_EUBOX|nr:bifunctional 5,10-methylenetetrahydrofolate dehydrogenase/5,10-methenyltetrahydrofolate cyclohydrolase [Eubacterium oxidoreducens]SDB15865.1 methylenetetrahydrofolate dehydrogenase (NADP+) / methenyltetrahydrofolate cyclohydrolase [Eubacterium oxidoreducens]